MNIPLENTAGSTLKKYIHTTGATNFENSGWFVVKM